MNILLIKDSILGKRYDLSVAFLSAKEMRAVTRRTKKVDHVSNVLSFPLSKNSGEILICKAAAKPWSAEYLFIHGLLHLKGSLTMSLIMAVTSGFALIILSLVKVRATENPALVQVAVPCARA